MSAAKPRPKLSPLRNAEYFFSGPDGARRFKEFALNDVCGRCLAENECDLNPRAYKYPASYQCAEMKRRWLAKRTEIGPEFVEWREGRCGTR